MQATIPFVLLAQVEASSAYRGIGLVKLMGRQSGFIAVQVLQLVCKVVDVVLKGCCRGATVSAAVLPSALPSALPSVCVPAPKYPSKATQACNRRCNQHPGPTARLLTAVDPAARSFSLTLTITFTQALVPRHGAVLSGVGHRGRVPDPRGAL